jgi:hypothetical protein
MARACCSFDMAGFDAATSAASAVPAAGASFVVGGGGAEPTSPTVSSVISIAVSVVDAANARRSQCLRGARAPVF